MQNIDAIALGDQMVVQPVNAVRGIRGAGQDFRSYMDSASSRMEPAQKQAVSPMRKVPGDTGIRSDVAAGRGDVPALAAGTVQAEGSPSGLTGQQATAVEQSVEDVVKDVLQMDDAVFEEAMAEMGITPVQLLDPSVLQEFIVFTGQGDDVMDLLTSETMFDAFTEIMQAFEMIDWEALTGVEVSGSGDVLQLFYPAAEGETFTDIPAGQLLEGASADVPVTGQQGGSLLSENAQEGDILSGGSQAGDVPAGDTQAGVAFAEDLQAGDIPSEGQQEGDILSGRFQEGDILSKGGQEGDILLERPQAGEDPVADSQAGGVPAGDMPMADITPEEGQSENGEALSAETSEVSGQPAAGEGTVLTDGVSLPEDAAQSGKAGTPEMKMMDGAGESQAASDRQMPADTDLSGEDARGPQMRTEVEGTPSQPEDAGVRRVADEGVSMAEKGTAADHMVQKSFPSMDMFAGSDTAGRQMQDPFFGRSVQAPQPEIQPQALTYMDFVGNMMQAVSGENMPEPVNMQQMIDIVDQVVEQIRSSMQDGVSTLEMQLNPESLGRLLLTVSSKNSVMTASFTVQTTEAKVALESQMATLRESLEQKDIKVDAVEVSVSDFAFSQSSQADTGDQKEFRHGDGRRAHFQSEDGEEEQSPRIEAEQVRRRVMQDSGSSIDYTA